MRTFGLNKNVTTSVWIVYILIVFEILYMISPFAFYYYAAYAVPLQYLQNSPFTSWLTVHLLPHFTFQSSPVISALNFLSWPLIIAGLMLFLVAFVQIYGAKFFRPGTVTGGLYRHIRHPQYLALAIVGFGTTIYWPRFIVFIMYAAMLFLYYFLARQEERICMDKFGASYEAYRDGTGMFFPKYITDRLPAMPSICPRQGPQRVLAIIVAFTMYLTLVTLLGVGVKNYALSKITYRYNEKQAVVAVAPLSQSQIDTALSIGLSEPTVRRETDRLDNLLVYILPTEWGIPELGIQVSGKPANYLLHPETHGNSLDFDASRLTVLITEPILASADVRGRDILKKSLSYRPVMEVMVDLDRGRATGVKYRNDRGKWDGIPVPIY